MNAYACPECKAIVSRFRHLHDSAHGILGTHLAGSERYVCTACGYVLTPGQAQAFGLLYTIDRSKNRKA